jgi:hypothetical protein
MMTIAGRHFVVAVLGLCPLLLYGQEAALPSAPSAVAGATRSSQRPQMVFTTGGPRQPQISWAHPLDSNQKFSSFVEQSMSPYTTISSAIAAGFRPTWNSSQNSEIYASRVGHAISDSTERGFFTKFLLPSLLHQDPRYMRSQETTTSSRAMYAISRVLIGRRDNGNPTLNTSELLGSVLAASVTNAYHPYRQYTPGETASRAVGGMASDAGINVLREFWPDIRGQLMDHGPKLMQGLITRLGPRIDATTLPPTN